MASSIIFKNFILDQLQDMQNIACRPMMGEFLLYYNGVLFGGIYDDRLLIKKTKSNEKFNLREAIPYKNAKPMFLVSNVDNIDYLKELINETILDLKK